MYDDDYSAEADKICSACGAKMVEYRHKLNAGMVTSLKKLYDVGGSAHLNALELNYNQRCNFQKLRYWGLVGRASNESGVWILSQYGRAFIEGTSTAPSHTWSYRGDPIDKEDNDITNVTFSDILEDRAYKKRDDYLDDEEPHS